jgi:ribosomal 50S subunit-recycling heat shock protein
MDAVAASGFSLSRDKASLAIKGGKATLNGGECIKPDRTVGEGDKITLRGYGKLELASVKGQSRKGRTIIEVKRYFITNIYRRGGRYEMITAKAKRRLGALIVLLIIMLIIECVNPLNRNTKYVTSANEITYRKYMFIPYGKDEASLGHLTSEGQRPVMVDPTASR